MIEIGQLLNVNYTLSTYINTYIFAALEHSLEGPQKVKQQLLLSTFSRELKTVVQTETCTRIFIAVLFKITKMWKQCKCPSLDNWINKMWFIHTVEYYSAI